MKRETGESDDTPYPKMRPRGRRRGTNSSRQYLLQEVVCQQVQIPPQNKVLALNGNTKLNEV